MFRELFFIFKSQKDVSQSQLQRIDSLGTEHTQVVSKVLSMAGASLADCSSIFTLDKAHGFEYALIRLANDVSEEIEKQIKHEVVYGSLKGVCDVFFSEVFPCFNETHKQSGALVMDMDMTSVQIEGIDEIARCLGVYDKVAEITFEAMNGKLDFNQSLTRRVALLEGGDADNTLAKVKEIMVETDGLSSLLTYCNTLKPDYGFKTCIASGGFHELICVLEEKYGLDRVKANRFEIKDGKFTGHTVGEIVNGTCIASGGFHELICVLEEKYGLDRVKANRFEIKDGKFTGHTVGEIVNGEGKADLIVELKKSGINKNNIISLGDGANDLLMMSEAGLGIAYHAKPKVQEADLIVELKKSGINKNNIISLGDGANDLLMMSEAGLGIAYHAKPKVQEKARNAMNVGDLSSVSALMQMTNKI